MNSGRKILKGQNNKKDRKQKKKKAPNGYAPKIIIGTIVTVIILIALFVGYEQLHPRLILTVDDKDIYLSDMMYDVYNAEKYYDSMEQLYKSYYGRGFWDSEVSEGVTGREAAKEEVMANATKRQVIYQKAIAEGYALTDEEKETIRSEVEEARKEMNFSQRMTGGLSAKKITAIKEIETIAGRYEKDKKDAFELDEAALTADISPEDYRQYDVQYYYVDYQSGETDEEGNPVPLSDEEKTSLKAELEALYATAATAEDFTKLIGEGEETGVKYSDDKNFIETDDTFLSEELRTKVKGMENDQISEILEDENGCYFVKMINNNSTERYDTEVENALNTEKDRLFEEVYNEILNEVMVEVNYDEWDKVEMGKMTV